MTRAYSQGGNNGWAIDYRCPVLKGYFNPPLPPSQSYAEVNAYGRFFFESGVFSLLSFLSK